MKTRKTPYSAAYSLRLIPVDKIIRFALILSRSFVSFQSGHYDLPIIPGSFTPDVQPEESEGGLIYNVGHTFDVALTDVENEELLAALSKQDLIAIYVNEAGQEIVSGSQRTPLAFTYSIISGKYQCKLTGITEHSEAFYSPF